MTRMQFTASLTEPTDTTARTITGTIAATGTLTDDGRGIRFDAGALTFPATLGRVKLLMDHDHKQPVGLMTSYDPAALVATFDIPPTAAGDAALESAATGLRDGLSVGISFANENDYTIDRDSGVVTVHRARVLEVSLCAIPAFDAARVTDVAASADTTPTPPRPEGTSMPTDTLTPDDLDTFGADLERRIGAQLAHALEDLGPADTPTPIPTFESFGAYVQAVASGDTAALEFHEHAGALLAATTDDAKPVPTWVRSALKLVDSPRRVINWFTREALPADGMSLEYLVIGSDDTKVAEQAKQGDALTGGEIKFESHSTPVRTFGGYSRVSRQIIDRARSEYLTTLFRAQTLRYARATEAAARIRLAAEITARTASATLTLPAKPTSADWISVLIDAVGLFDNTGHALDGVLVAPDVFKSLANLETNGGDRLMGVYGTGINQIGSVTVKTLSGNVAGIDIVPMPSLATGTVVAADRLGFTTWESGSAPFQLQDESVITLTKDYSVYGYAAFATQFPDALQPIKLGG